MSSHSQASLRRERFTDAPDAQQRRVLGLLLAQDGSTTRLCEAIAGGPIELHVIDQRVTSEVPEIVRRQLPGGTCVRRITSLAAHGQVMMDNLTYVALAGLEPDIEADLRAGQLPIGHLLARLWVRREPVMEAAELTQQLWDAVGLPDPAAARSYRIVTPGGARMVITEAYRRGMLMDR
jgi:chorismate-pyruvate lyase